MPINITMPALSPTMEEGNLAKWLVKEGDKVAPGDVIAEIETDKATMEVEAVDEGTVAKIVVPAGTEGVKVNALIAVLAAEGEDAGAAAKGGGERRQKAEAPKRESLRSRQRGALSANVCAEGSGKSAEAQPAVAPLCPAGISPARRGDQPIAAVTAVPSSPRRSPAASPRMPASTSRRSAAPARMAASSRPMSRRRLRAAAPRPAPAAKAAPAAGAAGCSGAEADVGRRGAQAVRRGLLRTRAARQYAQDHRPPAGRGEVAPSRIST